MDSLFGEGTSLPVRFFIAFVVVFALIGLTAWLIRRFGSGPLGGQKARGRAPRLAVIEAGAVDGRRKLVLIRRDNVEHLIMIGGPTDILVEANILRGQSSRERASSVADNLTRVLAGATSEDASWASLQPEPTPRPAPMPRPAPLEDSSQWALQPEQSPPPALPRRARAADPLAGLAAELSVRPAEPIAPAPRPAPAPAVEAPRVEAPRVEARMAPKPAPMPAPAPQAASQQQSADQNLADMAQRLEAALRRPAAPATPASRPGVMQPGLKPAAEAPRAAPPVTPPPAQPAAPAKAPEVTSPAAAAPEKPKEASAPAAAKPAPAPAKAAPEKSDKPDDMFGSLEEEMANLLGRPSGKPS
ncbi:flagellar biosynthetic protein FliO [Pseudorhodoplanes sinuspersici]|uniref:Uncharacterized protein n=1 Tax=Pseudorhodoplanes sinuspersici TaxID=1235591 RepID=A0A1W6ZVP5_9HYPH|nr:flagellar biosynthetic protein FliO [Pseudorhodoplanes sinuspersici]ARQ00815.1 hypothetical protein CAK95_18255 [Pseudorhodoplanes sinuspersici]RKE72430.1 flagellar biosynthesis protein FliO [Pseudorhodoplanes sinuspersici]